MQNYSKTVSFFKSVAIAEGISFLVLLFIAMPLKYFADLPQAVKWTGWIHGALFVAFIGLAYDVKVTLRKSNFWLIKAFAASVIPFGPFLLNKDLHN